MEQWLHALVVGPSLAVVFGLAGYGGNGAASVPVEVEFRDIRHMYTSCVDPGPRCTECEFEILLHVNTVQLPWPLEYNTGSYLMLHDRAGMDYERDQLLCRDFGQLAPDLEELIADELGWKARVPDAQIVAHGFHDRDVIQIAMIFVSTDPLSVEFVYDPADTLATYIRRISIE